MVSTTAVLAVVRTARPQFRNQHDRLAFAIHAAFLASGYSLIAAGAAADGDTSDTEQVDVGIDGWNELPNEYAFKYAKDGRAPKRVLVKCLEVGKLLMVDAIQLAATSLRDKELHLEIKVDDYAGDVESSDYAAQYNDLEGFLTALSEVILEPLSDRQQSKSSAVRATGQGDRQPQSPRSASSLVEETVPYAPRVGESDLNPIPPPGFHPMPQVGSGSGGMLLGPNDESWRHFSGGRPGQYPGAPPGSVPPGARFDPFGPPGFPGFEPGRFGDGNGASWGPRGANPHHPDLEFYRED